MNARSLAACPRRRVLVPVLLVLSACTPAAVAPPSTATTPETSSPAATSPPPSSSSTPSSSPTAALPDPVDIVEAGATAIPATDSTDWVVIASDHAWISGTGDGIGQYDDEGQLVGSVPLEGWCGSMDVGFDAIWTATCEPSGLARIDPATATVSGQVEFDEAIPDSETSVGAGEGAVWIVVNSFPRHLLKVDPDAMEVVETFELPLDAGPVRAGLGGVWVTNPTGGELLHVDPETGEIVASIDVGAYPRFLAVGEDSVWVMNQIHGSVSRIDPETDEVIATIPVGRAIQGGDIAVGGGYVWVRGGPELLAKIDPATNEVVERYGPPAGSGSVAANDDAVWVTAHDVETVWRLPLR